MATYHLVQFYICGTLNLLGTDHDCDIIGADMFLPHGQATARAGGILIALHDVVSGPDVEDGGLFRFKYGQETTMLVPEVCTAVEDSKFIAFALPVKGAG